MSDTLAEQWAWRERFVREFCEEHQAVSTGGLLHEFSSRQCDIGGSLCLSGARHELRWWDDGEPDVEEGECCTDCTYFLEYGEPDDQTKLDIEEERKGQQWS